MTEDEGLENHKDSSTSFEKSESNEKNLRSWAEWPGGVEPADLEFREILLYATELRPRTSELITFML
jgi:hypothetical protein